jgi:DNA-binding MarR family transcriptional regulator
MDFKRENSCGYMTNWAARLFARAIDRELKKIGVSSGQMPVFFALGDGAAMPQKALALAAAIEQPTMTATLSRMQRDGLIERRPDPNDGRSRLVALTPSAMAKAAAVRQAAMAVNAAAMAGLDEAERTAFMDMLARIVAALDEKPDAAVSPRSTGA